ncbi:MAG: hypothetical protein ACHQ2F_15045, partial [Desulfobaccales bacterium]
LEADVSPDLAKSTLLELVGKDLHQLARAAVERSGIFKRRLIHVGKKCGAIAREADYASISISGLMEALRGTPEVPWFRGFNPQREEEAAIYLLTIKDNQVQMLAPGR